MSLFVIFVSTNKVNNTYANIQDFERINEQDSIPIYDAGTDFKICMTSIGAYQENFKEQKNNPRKFEDCFCCFNSFQMNQIQ